MICVVIVNWNSGESLARCVSSLRAHAPEVRIVVVDNASTDGSLDLRDANGPGTLILRNTENRGFAAACNQGWNICDGDPVLFLNPDTESTPGAVEALRRCLAEEPGAWAAGGNLVGRDGATQAGFTVRRFPTVAAIAAEAFLLHRIWPGNPWTARTRMSGWDHASRMEVEQPAGACLMVRRSALEQLGGFDERYAPAWFEDVDLCRRIRGMGGRILFEPAARFIHQGGASLAHLEPGQFQELFHRNQLRYFEKHFGTDATRKVRRFLVAGLRLRALLSFASPTVTGTTRLQSARICWRAARKLRASGGTS